MMHTLLHVLRKVLAALCAGLNAVLMGVVKGYRLFLSPWLGSACRFTPTCSQYALQALQRHGPAAGSYLAARRQLGAIWRTRGTRTFYQVLDTGAGRSLLRLRLDTGRTHQIRVHLQALGCPVTGDFLYGREHMALPNRFALHSCHLSLKTLQHGLIEVESPLPQELMMLL